MRPLIARRTLRKAPRDPAPSKWGYRYQRLLLTPGFRATVRIGTPLILIGIIVATWFSDPANRDMLATRMADAKATIQTRPEFMMERLVITGADGTLTTAVEAVLPVTFPVSSFDLDFEELRDNVVALPQVADAHVKVGDAGALSVQVSPRVPVALWRDDGILRLIDGDGVFAGEAASRADRPHLPLIAGEGASDHISEALSLFRRAAPIRDRIRGLVRVGERRWDLVLDREQRVMLPEYGAAAALDRVIVLNQSQDLLKRDVVAVDMRQPGRPTIRLSSEAANALRHASQTRVTDE